jgi:hypothetical protein
VFKKTLDMICRYATEGVKLAIVDDGSDIPVEEADYRFDTNVGIARAKNKCFELLDDCEHIFLFDDDCYPVTFGWWKPYIESGEPHLMYIFKDFADGKKLNDNIVLYEDGKLRAWSHPRGVMCYFRRECLEQVGGMDPIYGRWGWEHPDLSDRIFNAGLTKFRYADVVGSDKLFYSADEHRTVKSTVWGADRAKQIRRNKELYEARKGSTEYIPYRQKENIVLTSYFTEQPDPQRGMKWEYDSSVVVPLLTSTAGIVPVVILYDAKPGTHNKAGGYLDDYDRNDRPDYVRRHRVTTCINPYSQRWISYYEYLVANRHKIDKVFCVDATDVEMLKDPFPHMEPGKLYTGDEPGQIGCEWMTRHHKSPVLQAFFKSYGKKQIVNAGLLGGDVDTVIEFCKAMMDFYFEAESDSFHKKQPNAGMTDMGAFNYIVYTRFADRMQHGEMVNTRFKANERNNISWFKHK